jgi:hypothetical protein
MRSARSDEVGRIDCLGSNANETRELALDKEYCRSELKKASHAGITRIGFEGIFSAPRTAFSLEPQ